jgi:hypothetical protein
LLLLLLLLLLPVLPLLLLLLVPEAPSSQLLWKSVSTSDTEAPKWTL